MRKLVLFFLPAILLPPCLYAVELSPAEVLIAGGHWKRARVLVETQIRENPNDALSNYLLSQIRNAFGERTTPLSLAEKAVTLDARTAKYHRQVAEVLGVMAQSSNALQQLFLARRFRKEIDTALALDPADTQAMRDLLEFYLLAPFIAGGDAAKATPLALQIGGIEAPRGFLAQARIAEFHKDAAHTEAALRKATEAAPASYAARIALAKFDLDQTHFHPEGAEALANEALKLDPMQVDAYSVLAQVQAHRGNWDELEVTLAAGASAVPDDLTPYYRAAERLIASHRETERAERYLRTYLGQEPEGNQPSAPEATRELEQIHRK